MDNEYSIKQGDLPLWELFSRLQKAKFPLGIGEYQLLIEALSKLTEEEIKDIETVKRLCCALWVKSNSDQLRFEIYFQQFVLETIDEDSVIPDDFSPILVREESLKQKILNWVKNRLNWKTSLIFVGSLLFLGWGKFSLIKDNQNPKQSLDNQVNTPPDILPLPTPSPNGKNPSDPPQVNPRIEVSEVVETEPYSHHPLLIGICLLMGSSGLIYGVWLLIKTAVRPKIILSKTSKVIAILPNELTPDYFPLTSRQMKQSWRQARCLVRQGTSTKLDVNGTVAEISRQGFFSHPVMIPKRVNRTQLLLLLDSSKFMLPFQNFCYQLAKTAQESGNFQKIMVNYFCQYPKMKKSQFYLHKDSLGCEIISLETLLTELDFNYAGVLIISEGGAMEENINKKRLTYTLKLIAKLKEYTNKLSWLNPFPPARWPQTTAGILSQHIPMFELNRIGLESALIQLKK
ncbi:MAG: hypothetical protein AB4060_06250 [Crocosphaera sp.]